jgi:hypothetical protein
MNVTFLRGGLVPPAPTLSMRFKWNSGSSDRARKCEALALPSALLCEMLGQIAKPPELNHGPES